MKASTFMAAALAGAGTPALTRSVIGAVPAHGGRLVAITPQLPDGSFGTADKDALTFVLGDIGNAVARLYGLVHALPEELCAVRSEEHTSELQSLMRISYAVFCLTKNTTKNKQIDHNK